jgi:alkanesulfonate monooxygenase SsuD/methylene tetrahydromethanopterin reductase-like flavin-dependent oxidoreductase (luciferase family)
MKFGLFGGAKVSVSPSVGTTGGMSGDSLTLPEYLAYVVLAEELGFSNLFVVEHHFTGGGQVSSSLGLLTFIAARTSKMRLGTAVIVLPWHNPVILAETVATLDLLSGGRFDFGVGKGYRSQEFHGFAIDQAEATARFEEALTFLRQALGTTERFTHKGKYWAFNDVVIEPRSLQTPHPPIWQASNSEASIRNAAREGFNILLDQISPIDQILDRIAIYRDEQKRAKVVTPGQVGVTRGLHIVESDEARQAMIKRYAFLLNKAGVLKWTGVDGDAGERLYIESDAPLIGRPEQLIGPLRRLEQGGADIVLLADMSGSASGLRSFAANVMPAFNASEFTVEAA